MRIRKLFFLVLLLPSMATEISAQKEISLWKDSISINNPDKYPRPGYSEERFTDQKRNVRVVRNVTNPTLTIFRAEESKNTGAAVIICPGGGMNAIEVEHEGSVIAREFAGMGINAFVLKYRHYSMQVALEDAKKALDYVTENALPLGIRRDAIGFGGFSAGGRLSLMLAYNFMGTDSLVCDDRIKFLMFIYTRTQEVDNFKVNRCFPPTFMTVTADDFRHAMNQEFFSLLQKNKVPSELHIFQKGLHGFGIGTGLCNCNTWPLLFRNWLVNNNIIVK